MKKTDSWFPENNGDHSNKHCCCGGHNASNPKKNLNHHSTKSKLLIRLSKKYWQNRRENIVI